MQIKLVGELSPKQLTELEEVYYQTISPGVQSDSKEIKYKYFDYYIENSSSLFFVAIDEQIVLGYVCGLENTLAHFEQLEMHSYLDYFREDLETYPAHLHINVHPKAQGRGVGNILMEKFTAALKIRGVEGIHIITLSGEENNHFYKKQNFDFHQIRSIHNKDLLLMGKLLNK